MPQNTYVLSVNGLTGDLPYELDRVETDESGDKKPVFGQVTHRHKNVVIDSNDICITGTSGPTIAQVLPTIANTMRPLILEQIGDSNDYVMHVGAGIPFEPVISED